MRTRVTTYNDKVAAEVRAEMARQNISQVALGNLIGHNQPWVSLRTNGNVPLTLDAIHAICDGLGITVIELLGQVKNDESKALDRRRQVKRSSTCSAAAAIVPVPRSFPVAA